MVEPENKRSDVAKAEGVKPSEAWLDRHLAAENAHDLEAIMGTYEQGPAVCVNGILFEGDAEVRRFHDRFGFGGAGAFSQIVIEEVARHRSDTAITLELRLSGVHTGAWLGYRGIGIRFTIPVCTVYRFGESGRLAREDVYFDSHEMLRQLELLEE